MIKDQAKRAQVQAKLEKVLARRYMLTAGLTIKSLMKYFAVDKGSSDIRMVYDGTANGLNKCCWVPTFWLATIDSLLRSLDSSSWMTDRDLADMFLNYQLHHTVRPFTGIDLTSAFEPRGGATGEELTPKRRWAYWDRNLMGFIASPHNSVKMALIVEEVARGNRREQGLALVTNNLPPMELNPFQWETVRLNIPGGVSYDSRMSWINKMRQDGLIACDIFTFVDDERIVGPTQELTWQASHKLASIQAYLGEQDSPRKARPCSKTPGAWAGAVVHVVGALGVCALLSEDKWNKMKTIVFKWLDVVASGESELNHSELISDRGFLVYATRTYPAMIPYLKGFHLSAETWRGNRDKEGYKLKEVEDDSSVVSGVTLGDGEDDDRIRYHLPWDERGTVQHAPANGRTRAVPRLKNDLEALKTLTDFDLPPLRVVRPSHSVHVYYGFGDASGKQFGSTKTGSFCPLTKEVDGADLASQTRYRVGLWDADIEKESSNYKEFKNLVDVVEEEAQAGRLSNCEFFLCTDSATAESCYYKGSSKSPLLHELVTGVWAPEGPRSR